MAERAGTMASMMHQRVVGVIENMSYLPCPHCTAEGKEHRLEVFGSGGGARVATTLGGRFGYDVPVLGEIPLDMSLREGGDVGKPIVESDPTAPGAKVLATIARSARRPRPRAGRHAARPESHREGLTPGVRDRSAGAGGHRLRGGRSCSVPTAFPSSPARPAGSSASCATSPTARRPSCARSSVPSTPTSSSPTSTRARRSASTSSRRWTRTTSTSRRPLPAYEVLGQDERPPYDAEAT